MSQSPVVVADVGKLALLALVVVGLFGGLIVGNIAMEDIDQYFLLIIGYLIGNGVNAVRRKAPSSVIVPNVNRDEVLTVAGSYPALVEQQHPETPEDPDPEFWGRS